MGEAVMTCIGDEGLKDDEVVNEVDVGEGCLVRHDKFSPRTSLRVLLVEADDCTRQVIGALLRKCGYNVSGVSDGLKAWEVLKGMPNGVDLILTEVDLPSISGFALLTLIMEHDSCKNIPVIMMSSNESVNIVYKCMLRGAADFLVKPVRKNELQNLWQHVWRREALKAGRLSDNDLLINPSSGACTPQNEECNEKGNDAQSSCSVQEIEPETESANTETTLGNSKFNVNKLGVCDTGLNEEDRVGGDTAALNPNSVMIGLSIESSEGAVMTIQQEDPGGKNSVKDHNTGFEASGNNDALISGSREVIDLMGNFQEHPTNSCVNSSMITGSTKFDPCPQLDLSLRRRYDESKSNQDTIMDEKSQAVHQSSASAFARYIAVQPSQNTLEIMPRECETSSDKHVYSPIHPSNLDASPPHQSTQRSLVHQATTESRQYDVSLYCTQGRMLPVTIPVKSARLDRKCPSDGSSLRPSYYNQTGDSLTPSPDSVGTRERYTSRGNQENSKALENSRNASSTNDRNQNSNLCNGSVGRLNSIGGSGSVCGSNGSGNGNPFTQSKADGISTQEENINQALQREAALAKFRQKRKDRCFDKKVRYESRKKLAEQRPRVKGQFVRQVPAVDVSTTTIEDTQ